MFHPIFYSLYPWCILFFIFFIHVLSYFYSLYPCFILFFIVFQPSVRPFELVQDFATIHSMSSVQILCLFDDWGWYYSIVNLDYNNPRTGNLVLNPPVWTDRGILNTANMKHHPLIGPGCTQRVSVYSWLFGRFQTVHLEIRVNVPSRGWQDIHIVVWTLLCQPSPSWHVWPITQKCRNWICPKMGCSKLDGWSLCSVLKLIIWRQPL